MIPRETTVGFTLVVLLVLTGRIGSQGERTYDTSEWIPIEPSFSLESSASDVVEDKTTAQDRVLNVNAPAQRVFPSPDYPYNKRKRPIAQPIEPIEQPRPRKLNNLQQQQPQQQQQPSNGYQFETPPSMLAKSEFSYYDNDKLPSYMFDPPTLSKEKVVYVPFKELPNKRPIPDGYVDVPSQHPQAPAPEAQNHYEQYQLPFNSTFYQSLNPVSINDDLYRAIGNDNGTVAGQQQVQNQVQLVYVPVENLALQQQQQRQLAVPNAQEQEQQQQPNPYYSATTQELPAYAPAAAAGSPGVRLQNIQQDFAQQALRASQFQRQLSDDAINPVKQEPFTTTTRPRKRPHQPPLAVFLESERKAEIGDVLSILRTTKTIAVQDAVTPDSPKVFIGPSNIDSPQGYTKFPLPYLNNINGNRIERKIDQLPFFVAPVSYRTPAGYAKIALPAPHVGSVVISLPDDEQPVVSTTVNPFGFSPDVYGSIDLPRNPDEPILTSLDVLTQFHGTSQRPPKQQEVFYAQPQAQQQQQNYYKPTEQAEPRYPPYADPTTNRIIASTIKPKQQQQQLPETNNPLELAINDFELHQINGHFEDHHKVKHLTTRRPPAYEEEEASTRAPPPTRGRYHHYDDEEPVTQATRARTRGRGRGNVAARTTTTSTTTTPAAPAETERYTVLEEFQARRPTTESYPVERKAEPSAGGYSGSPYLPEASPQEPSTKSSHNQYDAQQQQQRQEPPASDYYSSGFGANVETAPANVYSLGQYQAYEPKETTPEPIVRKLSEASPSTTTTTTPVASHRFHPEVISSYENREPNQHSFEQSQDDQNPKQSIESPSTSSGYGQNLFKPNFDQTYQDQAVRSLLVPNLLAPAPKESSPRPAQDKVVPPPQPKQEEEEEAARPPPSSSTTEAETTGTTRANRVRGRTRGRPTTSTTSTTNDYSSRRPSGNRRRPQSSRYSDDSDDQYHEYHARRPASRGTTTTTTTERSSSFYESEYGTPSRFRTTTSEYDYDHRRPTHRGTQYDYSSRDDQPQQQQRPRTRVRTESPATEPAEPVPVTSSAPPQSYIRFEPHLQEPTTGNIDQASANNEYPQVYEEPQQQQEPVPVVTTSTTVAPTVLEYENTKTRAPSIVDVKVSHVYPEGSTARSSGDDGGAYGTRHGTIKSAGVINNNSNRIEQSTKTTTARPQPQRVRARGRSRFSVSSSTTAHPPSARISRPTGGTPAVRPTPTTTEKEEQEFYGFTRQPNFAAPANLNIQSVRPPAVKAARPTEEAPLSAQQQQLQLQQQQHQQQQQQIQFVGEIRPKYSSRTTSAAQPEEPENPETTQRSRIRTRTRTPTRGRTTTTTGDQAAEPVTRRTGGTTRTRGRGGSHYRGSSENAKRANEDEDVANQNYPASFLQKLDAASSPKPVFQITVDPLDDDQSPYASIQVSQYLPGPNQVASQDKPANAARKTASEASAQSGQNRAAMASYHADVAAAEASAQYNASNATTAEASAQYLSGHDQTASDGSTTREPSAAAPATEASAQYLSSPNRAGSEGKASDPTIAAAAPEAETSAQHLSGHSSATPEAEASAQYLSGHNPAAPEAEASAQYFSSDNRAGSEDKASDPTTAAAAPEAEANAQQLSGHNPATPEAEAIVRTTETIESTMSTEESTTPTTMTTTTTTTTTTKEPTKSRKRGVWKLIAQRPADPFEVSESQNYHSIVNAFQTIGKDLKRVFKPLKPQGEAEQAKQLTTEPASPTTTITSTSTGTSTEATPSSSPANFFDTIYKMFFRKPTNRTSSVESSTPLVPPMTTTVTNPTFPEEITEAVTTTNPTEVPPEASTRTFDVEPWAMREVKTARSTEVTHETEICYKGRCIKSKEKKRITEK